ncbi:unnamed protein product, partial [Allacma fusca]
GKSPIPDEIKARLRYGQVPLLEFDGKRLVQSHAIFRYLAQQFKLTGNDEFEAAQCDEIIDAVKDVQQLFITAYVDKDETRKAEGLKAAEVAANTPPGNSPIPDEVKARLKFGQVPLLEFNGKRLVQSQAIFRYLAKQFNLTGKDEFEAAQCDEVVDAVKDTYQVFMPVFFEKDDSKKAEAMSAAVTSAKTRFISKFNELIEKEIKARLNYKQLPLLEFEDKRLVQSCAIFRYLANQFGLTGKDDFESAQCDEIVEAIKDIFALFWPIMSSKGDKAEALKAAVEKAQKQFLS